MKIALAAVSILMFVYQLTAQNVGIGTTSPNASAALEISSNNKGLLLPRVPDTSAIANPAKGLIIYTTAKNKLYYYDGSHWQQTLAGGGGMDSLWYKKNDTVAYSAQKYIGINTDYKLFPPQANLQVQGTLLVQQPVIYTSASPASLHTMINGEDFSFPNADSSGRFFDPGGSNANYANKTTAIVTINQGPQEAAQVMLSFEKRDWGLAGGDTLWVSDLAFPQCRNKYWYRYTSDDLIAPDDIFADFELLRVYISFKSDLATTSKGFDITFRKIFTQTTGLVNNIRPIGNILFFDPANASFKAGRFINNPSSAAYYTIAMGYLPTASASGSTAIGYSPTASGNFSTALGRATASGSYATAMGGSVALGLASTAFGSSAARGDYSTALGIETNASGNYSTVMGNYSTASGDYSTAMGNYSTASGNYSTAMGSYATASGSHSVAIGRIVSTDTKSGSFVFGDANPNDASRKATTTNQFNCFFNGGYYFVTDDFGIADIGVKCLAGQNSWSAISDVRLKEKFEPVNGENFLYKISTIPLTTWNYKGQDSKNFRHYGPMAQDFYAAFGKDRYGTVGCDTLINQQDFLGVNLIAIQALEKRTAKILQLEKDSQDIKKENETLKNMLLQIRKELDALKAASNK